MEPIKPAKEVPSTPAGIRKYWREEREKMGSAIHDVGDNEALDVFLTLSSAANEFNECFLALDIATHGEEVLRKHPDRDKPEVRRMLGRLGHARALAMLRTGATDEARALLEKLACEHGQDLEIAAALARCYKDYAFLATTPEERKMHLERALELYLAADNAAEEDKSFPGINAAAIALWLDRREEAETLARRIEATCQRKLNPPETEANRDYWLVATLAEAQLILGKKEDCARTYAKARALIDVSRKWANLESTRKQARRICKHAGWDFDFLDKVFQFPTLVVFSGHMFDQPGRSRARFPEANEEAVRQKIKARLEQLNAGFGVSPAACGSDFLFIEEMLERKAEVHVVLPWPREDFIRSSVDLKPGANWVERFNGLLEKVTSITYLSQQTEPKKTGIGYEYLNQTISGLAIIEANVRNAELVPMVVWDGQPGDGPGGTAGFVSLWRDCGKEPEIIAPSFKDANANLAQKEPVNYRAPGTAQLTVARGEETVKTMLFADVAGYTKIPPGRIEIFVSEFLSKVSALMDEAPATERPILANTWGDAIYLVFDEVIAAGQFALRLRELVETTDWQAAGLGTNLRLRVSLHTGPVLLCVDPIIRRITITGSHVSHTARIEPVVEEGEIWTSEGFAAHTAITARLTNKTPGYRLDYLGAKELSKHYGTYPLFRLRPNP